MRCKKPGVLPFIFSEPLRNGGNGEKKVPEQWIPSRPHLGLGPISRTVYLIAIQHHYYDRGE